MWALGIENMTDRRNPPTAWTMLVSILAVLTASACMFMLTALVMDTSEFEQTVFVRILLIAAHPATPVILGILAVVSILCAEKFASDFRKRYTVQVVALSVVLLYTALTFAAMILPLIRIGEVITEPLETEISQQEN